MSAIGRFVAALVVGLAAGIPFVAGIAIESAVIAWIFDSVFRWWPFGQSYPVILAVQLVPLALFAVPAVVGRAVIVARDGWPS